jgi:dimethylamine monooxygenase subunit A
LGASTVDFDFDNIAVPFRMQPGLRRLEPDHPQLVPLAPASALYREKQAVMQAGESRHVAPGFNPSPALEAVAERLPGGAPLELACEQDLAVLDGDTGILPWLCVCVPSHWAPEEKVGLHFAALHAPVADSAALLAASAPLVKLVTSGECWERHVWTFSPSGRYDQHPRRHAREPWPESADAEEFGQRCWLRVERQTFFPVGRGTQQAVFAIRVMLEPLPSVAGVSGAARRLHDSLASMSDPVLAYKGLAAARERLLGFLAARMA